MPVSHQGEMLSQLRGKQSVHFIPHPDPFPLSLSLSHTLGKMHFVIRNNKRDAGRKEGRKGEGQESYCLKHIQQYNTLHWFLREAKGKKNDWTRDKAPMSRKQEEGMGLWFLERRRQVHKIRRMKGPPPALHFTHFPLPHSL